MGIMKQLACISLPSLKDHLLDDFGGGSRRDIWVGTATQFTPGVLPHVHWIPGPSLPDTRSKCSTTHSNSVCIFIIWSDMQFDYFLDSKILGEYVAPTRTLVCPSRYFESDGGWHTMPRRPQNGTSGIAILHTSVGWTKVFCSGRIGVATKKGSKQQCPTGPKVGRFATRGRQPSSKLRSWYLLGNCFPPFSTRFFLSKSKRRV